MQQHEITPHLFRTEYSKIVAVLCKKFDLRDIEIAEDIAADTFLKASESWPIKGMPENPTAWLYTVAKNKAKDYFKHIAVFESKVKQHIATDEQESVNDLEFDSKDIADSQLAMIFAVCNPVNSAEAQVCLALQILCGFSIQEIANAFVAKTETIKKRLLRAREVLRKDRLHVKVPPAAEITSRLSTVLTTLYLLFNEGYFSKTADLFIRKDLCSEAMRLLLVLTENPLTNTSQTNALLALMCFQSSRIGSRIDDNHEVVLLENQDKNLWDQSLIEKGNFYLINAFESNDVSKYHLEAAIAYWHTTPVAENKWQNILQLYDNLLTIAYSPMAALNRVFALAKVQGNECAITEAEHLNLTNNHQYHSLLGYLYTSVDAQHAISHYQLAIQLSASKTEKQMLQLKIAQLLSPAETRGNVL
ncbi:RNA polymerase sigma factor [Mucilaginibacter jinjuensis]|uniref:Sigma factor n=1 Tax=Mucilaginibacter jinjuensis TaxID=1176721 RepID=A0ABY7T5Y7_9SPHI|nr:DUF6596 domain-containing protein [Mucilaginibacter jinjuensis]WCT11575.1 sigma factor [Mucilaginibacter jinjuensis]